MQFSNFDFEANTSPSPCAKSESEQQDRKKSMLLSPSTIRRRNFINHTLPVELLVTIFEMLAIFTDSPATIETAGMVCKRWHAVSKSDVLWSFVARRWVPALPLIRLVSSFEAEQLEAKRQRHMTKLKRKETQRLRKEEEEKMKNNSQNTSSSSTSNPHGAGTAVKDNFSPNEDEDDGTSSTSSSGESTSGFDSQESAKTSKRKSRKDSDSFINRLIPPSTSPTPKDLVATNTNQKKIPSPPSLSSSSSAETNKMKIGSSNCSTGRIVTSPTVTSPNRMMPHCDSSIFAGSFEELDLTMKNNKPTPCHDDGADNTIGTTPIPGSASFGSLAAALYMQAHSNKQFTPPIAASATPEHATITKAAKASSRSSNPTPTERENVATRGADGDHETIASSLFGLLMRTGLSNNSTHQHHHQNNNNTSQSDFMSTNRLLQPSQQPRRLLQLVPRELVVALHNEQVNYVLQCQKYLLVEHQKRYTVNLFITFMLLSFTFCCLFFVIALELMSLQDSAASSTESTTMSSVIVQHLLSIFSVDAAFNLLWLSVTLGAGAVVTNIVMTAHFEPQPLIQRILDHWPLIGASIFGLVIMMLVIFFPFYAIQENIKSCYGMTREKMEAEGRLASRSATESSNDVNFVEQWTQLGCLQYSWVVGTLPIILALTVWQITVLLKVRATLEQFVSLVADKFERGRFLTVLNRFGNDNDAQERNNDDDEEGDELWDHWLTPATFFAAITYLTPLTIALGVLLFAWYLETGSHLFLILSMAPFIFIVLVLIVIFAVDYAVGGNLADGVAFVGLGMMCLTPVTAFVFPIRGLTGLPFVLTFGGAFVAYADKTLKLIRTVDDLGAVA